MEICKCPAWVLTACNFFPPDRSKAKHSIHDKKYYYFQYRQIWGAETT